MLIVPVKGEGIRVYKLSGMVSSGSATAMSGRRELAIDTLALLMVGNVWAALLCRSNRMGKECVGS